MRVALQALTDVVEVAAVTRVRSRAGKHTFMIGILVVAILYTIYSPSAGTVQ